MGETRRRIGYALGGTVLAAGFLLVPGAGVATAADPCTTVGATTTCSYGPTGGEQQFTVPTGVTSVHVDAVGASGAEAKPWPFPREVPTPSSGAHVTGQLTGLSANQVLYVEVGGAASGGAGCSAGLACHGGFNGGGSSSRYGGGGGGASDVRSTSSSATDATSSLSSRLIVAAGGGGGAGGADGCEILAGGPLPGGIGGDAGAAGGPGQVCPDGVVAGSTGGGAGTATAPGAGGLSTLGGDVVEERGVVGALGDGANASPLSVSSAGAGGGGLYGGGSGADIAFDLDGNTAVAAGGGGGGSSFTPAGGTADLADGPASVTITYTLSLGGAPDQLTALGQAVAGVGPGTSLSDKVTTAQQNLARGNTAGACGALTGFVNEVTAQSGKKIPVATATQLIASAHGIQAAIRC